MSFKKGSVATPVYVDQDGNLSAGVSSIPDPFVVTTITATGTTTTTTLNVTGVATTVTLNVTGVATINDLNVTTNIDSATINVTGLATLNDLNVTTNIDAASLAVTGHIDCNSLLASGAANYIRCNNSADTGINTGFDGDTNTIFGNGRLGVPAKIALDNTLAGSKTFTVDQNSVRYVDTLNADTSTWAAQSLTVQQFPNVGTYASTSMSVTDTVDTATLATTGLSLPFLRYPMGVPGGNLTLESYNAPIVLTAPVANLGTVIIEATRIRIPLQNALTFGGGTLVFTLANLRIVPTTQLHGNFVAINQLSGIYPVVVVSFGEQVNGSVQVMCQNVGTVTANATSWINISLNGLTGT
jgi:hypothetical protein